MKKEELENYEPKGQLKGFPEEIIAKMLDYQEEQGNQRNVSIFERDRCDIVEMGGFDWYLTKEGHEFWCEVIYNKNFKHFFEKYPKKDNQDYSQEFKVGDKVIDIISGRIGRVTYIDALNMDNSPVFVDFNDDEGLYFTLNGRDYDTDKHPRLLHYREDYNYNLIDFDNLPKRQKSKIWRAEEGGVYNFVSFDNECWFFSDDTKDDYDHFDNDNYNSGNYFSTEVEAEIIAQKMNTYFKQLIQEEHEHKKRY